MGMMAVPDELYSCLLRENITCRRGLEADIALEADVALALGRTFRTWSWVRG